MYKSCGNCDKSVPITTSVGDRCPHCGVRFGGERTRTVTSSASYGGSTYSGTSYGTPSAGSASAGRADAKIFTQAEAAARAKTDLILGLIYVVLEAGMITKSLFFWHILPFSGSVVTYSYFLPMALLLIVLTLRYKTRFSFTNPAVFILSVLSVLKIVQLAGIFMPMSFLLKVRVYILGTLYSLHLPYLHALIVLACVLILHAKRTDSDTPRPGLWTQAACGVLIVAVLYVAGMYAMRMPYGLYTFHRLGIGTEKTVPRVVDSLASSNESIVRMGLITLGRMGPAAVSAVPALEEFVAGGARFHLDSRAEWALKRIKGE
jgi:hypothetical protein